MSDRNPCADLPDRTLLATLVGTEQADALLARANGRLWPMLREAQRMSYTVTQGLPPSTLAAAIELVKRMLVSEAESRSVLTSPDAVRNYLKLELGQRPVEAFVCLMLDAQHHLIAAVELFRGTIDQTAVYPREVVRAVLECHAKALICVHNHPSGTAEPSQADIILTQALKSALATIDVPLLDHLIVAGPEVLSMAEHGQI